MNTQICLSDSGQPIPYLFIYLLFVCLFVLYKTRTMPYNEDKNGIVISSTTVGLCHFDSTT